MSEEKTTTDGHESTRMGGELEQKETKETKAPVAISVVITTHPALDHHLKRCLDSVLWQLQPQDDCFVVHDGLLEEGSIFSNWTETFHTQGAGPHVNWQAQPKGGIAKLRNAVLGRALDLTRPWVKFLDVDDLLAPFALNGFREAAAQVDGMGSVALLVGMMARVHNGRLFSVEAAADRKRVIETQNPFLISATMIRLAAMQAVGGFDERIEFEEDWDFWLRLYRANWLFARIHMPVCYYTIDDAERAAKVRNHTVEGVDVREYLRRKYNLPPPPAS